MLIGGRVALNVVDSNVIDVGYSGVIGADRIADRKPIYGNFPSDDQSGDTYGPVAYYAYVPFEQAFPWSGTWDDLPAAHAASIFFDLATMAALFLLGRRIRRGRAGTELGVLLCFAWAACPYTAFALESNTNDALVSLTLAAALLCLTSPVARGITLALSAMTKFAPLALGPLFATYGATDGGRDGSRAPLRQSRDPVHDRLRDSRSWSSASRRCRTRASRPSGTARSASRAGEIRPSASGARPTRWAGCRRWSRRPWLALAVLVAFRPRRRDHVTVAALGAAVMIGMQLTVDHWFYLYIPWFLPFLLIALLGRGRGPTRPQAPQELSRRSSRRSQVERLAPARRPG